MLLFQKEVIAKREDDKRKRFMKDQRQKTVQRVKQYMEVSDDVSRASSLISYTVK